MKTMMMLLLATTSMTMTVAKAEEESENMGTITDKIFEINKENCSLPMKEIRRRLPNREAQKKALDACMKKATEERWGSNTLLLEDNTIT